VLIEGSITLEIEVIRVSGDRIEYEVVVVEW